jgi:hypothetical protein
MPSYDNDAMAVIKGTDNDGVVIARADADVATVQCMRSCEDQHSENNGWNAGWVVGTSWPDSFLP